MKPKMKMARYVGIVRAAAGLAAPSALIAVKSKDVSNSANTYASSAKHTIAWTSAMPANVRVQVVFGIYIFFAPLGFTVFVGRP